VVYYYRKVILGVLLGLALLLVPLSPASVHADVLEARVHITVSAWAVGTPSGLILTYVSDYEVGIEWTKGIGAENTMVRGAVGRLPESITDGYLVYYGNGTSASDTGVSLDETVAPVYYRAWSQNEAGGWELIGVSDSIEGVGMTLFAVIALAVSMTGMGFWKSKSWLFILAGAAWFGLGAYGLFLQNAATGDLLWILGWIGLVAAIIMFIVAFSMWERGEVPVRLSPGEAWDNELRAARQEVSDRKNAKLDRRARREQARYQARLYRG